jgi:hypothetical protein
VDVFIMSQHGNALSNGPVLVHGIAPRVALMSTGPRNYATSSTDGGHVGEASDGSFALGHPEKVVDLGMVSATVCWKIRGAATSIHGLFSAQVPLANPA